jgi:hypothetical protein
MWVLAPCEILQTGRLYKTDSESACGILRIAVEGLSQLETYVHVNLRHHQGSWDYGFLRIYSAALVLTMPGA